MDSGTHYDNRMMTESRLAVLVAALFAVVGLLAWGSVRLFQGGVLSDLMVRAGGAVVGAQKVGVVTGGSGVPVSDFGGMAAVALGDLAFWCLVCSALALCVYIFLRLTDGRAWKPGQLQTLRVAVLVAIFLLSVLIRIPNIGRPLGYRHETITANTLTALLVWERQGGARHAFNPVMTFPGDTNLYADYDCGFQGEDGVCRYVSYPPFSYMLPYALSSLFGIRPGVVYLQGFNLALHFVSALFIYLIAARLSEVLFRRRSEFVALSAYALYVFAPLTMWFQSNTYFVETAVQPFLAAGIYFAVRLAAERRPTAFSLAGYGIAVFLMSYTEWIGLIFAAVTGLFFLIGRRRGGGAAVLILSLVCSSAAVALTLVQYSSVIGAEGLLAYLTAKFGHRAGLSGAGTAGAIYVMTEPKAWLRVALHYARNLGPLLLLAAAVLGCAWRSGTAVTRGLSRGPMLVFLVAAGVPPLIHHLALFNYTAVHDYSPLKTVPLIAVIAALAVGSVVRHARSAGRPLAAAAWQLSVVAILILSVIMYQFEAAHSDNIPSMRGTAVAESAGEDEAVFARVVKRDGEAVRLEDIRISNLYARRNIAPWSGEQDAEEIMRKSGVRKGVLFEFRYGNPDYYRLTRFVLE